MLKYPLVILLAASVANGQQPEEPDLAKEAKFHEIYLNFNQSPTSDEDWQKALSTAQAQTYKIQKNDTLWDLSTTLFADSNFWPKIWSLNTEGILNPHQITPGQTIQFIPGTMSEAPSLAMAQEGAAEAVAEAPEAGAEAQAPAVDPNANPKLESLANLQIPAPKKEYVPYSPIPTSLPYWQFGSSADNKKAAVDFQVEPFAKNYDTPITLTHYLVEEKIEGIGKIIETEHNLKSATDYQYVVVEFFEGQTSKKNLLAIDHLDKIKDPFEGNSGFMVEVQGEIEVLEPVDEENNRYRAIVKRTLNHVTVGAILTQGEIQRVDTVNVRSGPTVSARIIGGQYSRERRIFGPDSIVFLNMGSAQGITEGIQLPIFKIEKVRNHKTKVNQNARQIGQMTVVKSTPSFATAVITSMQDDVRIGDATVANPTE